MQILHKLTARSLALVRNWSTSAPTALIHGYPVTCDLIPEDILHSIKPSVNNTISTADYWSRTGIVLLYIHYELTG